jgi:serine/threonine-protein kinase
MPIRKLLNSFIGPANPKKLVRMYFSEDAIPCEKCGTAISVEELTALTFTRCPKCNYNNFVPLRVGDFLLAIPIGAGGMASAYKAYHRETADKVYAVKILMEEHLQNEAAVQAFLGEAEIHKQIPPHPNLVTYIDSGLQDDRYFYAMEFVEGMRLLTRLESRGRIEEPEALRLLSQILSALQHIYDQGFLYRDLSAGNVIINKDGQAVLIDFGLTLPIQEALELEPTKFIDGTVEFIPPERLFRTGEDQASLIYSLGMLAFFMLRGETLIKGSSLVGTAKKHVAKLRVSFTPAMLPDCSKEVVALVSRMIQTQHEDRYQSFTEVFNIVCDLMETRS